MYLRISIAIFQNPPPNPNPQARPEKESKHVFVKHYAVEKNLVRYETFLRLKQRIETEIYDENVSFSKILY